MSDINKRQVRFGGNFDTLYEFSKKRWVKALPFVETQTLTCAAEEFKLIDSGILAGNISVGTTSLFSGGVVAAALVGAVGTSANTNIADALGNMANIVSIRDASTNDSILVSDREVFGLIQCASDAVDGDAIGAESSENLQISFVYIDASNALVVTPITGTIEFSVNKMITEENLPTYEVSNSNVRPDIIGNPVATLQKVAKYIVTTAFEVNEVIDFSDGTGAVAGITTVNGDYAATDLDESANAFRDNNQIEVLLNGVEQFKSVDIVWDSATTGHFAIPLDITDIFTIKYFA